MRRAVEWWFAVSIAVLHFSLVFTFFLVDGAALILTLAAAISTFLALVGLLVVLVTVRSRRQLAVLLSGLLALLLVPLSHRGADWLYFSVFRSRLEALANEIRSYEKIHDMSDGNRHWVSLNGEVFLQNEATGNVERILRRDDVSQAQYQTFRKRLVDLHLIGFEVHEGFVAFLWDGMLDDLAGFLRVEPGAPPPHDRYFLFNARLVYLKPLAGGWYRFGTT